MAVVGKTAKKTKHKNTVVLKKLKVLFQHHAGTAGTDAVRGISGVSYTFKANGKIAATGTTAADGGVEVDVAVGSNAVLEIFDTKYTLKIVNALEAETTAKGQQRRLQQLGYELGEVDGSPGARTNDAALNFQADNAPLDPTGTIDAAAQAALKTQFGE